MGRLNSLRAWATAEDENLEDLENSMTDRPALKPKDAPDLSSFSWDDALLLDAQLTEEERLIRDSARAYAQEKLQSRVIAAFREDKSDPGAFAEMGEMGLLGTTIPEEYGGLGAGYVTYDRVEREVERVARGYR